MDVIIRILQGALNLGRDLFIGLAGVLGMGEYGAGFLTGVLVAGFIGFLLFRFNVWMKNANAAFQPQRIMQMSSRTPAQVLGSSVGNALKISGVLVVALTLLFLLAGLAWPGDAAVTGAFGVVLLLLGGVMS
jgi:hypothetical protein